MDNFNVATDAWMPVLDKLGKFSYVSPIELFSGEYESFAGDEIQNYVMMLFCEAIVHSSDGCQPDDIVEWQELKDGFASKSIEYLDRNKDLFWMRGDKPFLQDISLLNLEEVKFEKIRLSEKTPSNNAAILNTNQLTTYTEWKDIVMDLIVHQSFSMVVDKTKASGIAKGKLNPSRWCVSGSSTNGNYNFYVTSDTLIDSIWLNLVYGINFGRPIWETYLTSDVMNYCSQLIPLTARVYISDDMTEMKYMKGLDYPEYGHNKSHLFMTVVNDKQRAFGVFSNMRLWKEFNSILQMNDVDKPIQLASNRIKSSNFINIHGIGCTYKTSTAGLYATESIITSYYNMKSPDRLDMVEYKKLYANCIKQVDIVTDLVNKSLSCVNTKQNKLRTQVIKYFMKSLDDISFNLFDYTDINDLIHWNNLLNKVCNETLDYIGVRWGYLAQFKVSESKSWYELKNALTHIV